MTEEKQKIVIVIGAGASCDFVMSEEKKLNENHGDIKYEIWKNTQDSVDENPNKNARYFLSQNNRKNYSFPSGEALIKMIGNPRKVFNFFGNEILDGLYEDFCKKVDWSLEGEDKNIIKLKKNFLKYFFEFLKNPIYQNQKDYSVNNFSFDQPLGDSIEKYEREIGAIATIYALSKEKLRIKKFSKTDDFFNFIDLDNFGIRKSNNNNGNSLGIKFLNDVLRENFKIEISQQEDLEYRVTNKINKKMSTLFDDILKFQLPDTYKSLAWSNIINLLVSMNYWIRLRLKKLMFLNRWN